MKNIKLYKKIYYILLILMILRTDALSQSPDDNESIWFHPEFNQYIPEVIAVLPMDNLSLDPDIEKVFYSEISSRMKAKGFRIISDDKVNAVMKELGVRTPGQLSAFSPEKIGEKLSCNAILMGQIDQSATIHAGFYDAVVVSCSLSLKDCKTGKILWSIEQQRTAHRQWQLDPVNLFINFVSHENSSREKRAVWLAHEMLKNMPNGKIKVETDDLLNQSKEIKADEE